MWKSLAKGSFTIGLDQGESIDKGTKIVPQMKEDQSEYTESKKMKQLQLIGYLTKLWVQKVKEMSDDEAEEKDDEKKHEDEESKNEDVGEEHRGKISQERKSLDDQSLCGKVRGKPENPYPECCNVYKKVHDEYIGSQDEKFSEEKSMHRKVWDKQESSCPTYCDVNKESALAGLEFVKEDCHTTTPSPTGNTTSTSNQA